MDYAFIIIILSFVQMCLSLLFIFMWRDAQIKVNGLLQSISHLADENERFRKLIFEYEEQARAIFRAKDEPTVTHLEWSKKADTIVAPKRRPGRPKKK